MITTIMHYQFSFLEMTLPKRKLLESSIPLYKNQKARKISFKSNDAF